MYSNVDASTLCIYSHYLYNSNAIIIKEKLFLGVCALLKVQQIIFEKGYITFFAVISTSLSVLTHYYVQFLYLYVHVE